MWQVDLRLEEVMLRESLGVRPTHLGDIIWGASGTLLTTLNKSDARFSRKCPWAVDLQNMAMSSPQGTDPEKLA